LTINSCTSTIVFSVSTSNVLAYFQSLTIVLQKGKHSSTTQHPISHLYLLDLCLLHFLALFLIFLVFLSQRQCMMLYLILVKGKPWQSK